MYHHYRVSNNSELVEFATTWRKNWHDMQIFHYISRMITIFFSRRRLTLLPQWNQFLTITIVTIWATNPYYQFMFPYYLEFFCTTLFNPTLHIIVCLLITLMIIRRVIFC